MSHAIKKLTDSWVTRAPRLFTASDLLGLPNEDLVKLLRRVEAGLPVSVLDRFQTTSGLSGARLAKLARIAPRTMARRRDERRLSAEESDRLLRIARLFAAAANLFDGDVVAGTGWLSKPLEALGGAIPIEIAETEVGCHAVERVIQQLEHGVFP